MRILMVTAEGPSLQRTGALIDVMNALPRELRERGHEVSVVLPYCREIRENVAFAQEDTGISVDARVGDDSDGVDYARWNPATDYLVEL